MTPREAAAVLSPYYALLRDIVLDGFNDYAREYGHVSFKHHARSRACLTHDHIFHYAKERLAGCSEFSHIPTKIRNLFDVSGAFVLQFKKLNKRLQTSNIETQLTLDFDGQREVYCLPGIPPRLPRLAIGYVPRNDWTAVDGVFLTYSVHRQVIWSINLTLAEDSKVLTLPAVYEQSTTPAKRIRAKASHRKQRGKPAAAV